MHVWDMNLESLVNTSFGILKSQVRNSMANIVPFAVIVVTQPMQFPCSLGLGVQKLPNYRAYSNGLPVKMG